MQISFFNRILRRKAHKKKGQSLIVVALALVMIFAILAVTLNVQQLTTTRTSLQTAADSAALAGANIQSQGKELIKVCEMLRFTRDAIIALIQDIGIIVRDIGYIFIGIGIAADAASPFCFCAGTWAFPIADGILNVADTIDNVATEAKDATQGFYDGLGTAEDVIADVTPFLALVNAFEFGQKNGADFTLPVPLPITDKKNDAFTMKTDPNYSATYNLIQQKRQRVDQINKVEVPAAQYALLDQLKIYDVLSLKIDRHDDARLTEAQAERGQITNCQINAYYNPCSRLDDEIATATAQKNSPNPDDTEALKAAKDAYSAAGCDGQNPPPASTCDPLNQAIADAQKTLDDDKKARDDAAQLNGTDVTGGAAKQYKDKIDALQAEAEQLRKDIDDLGKQLDAARQAATDKSAAEINARDLSFGRAGLEGIMVIVVKKGEKPITNFGGGDPGLTWASAFGLTVTTSDPAKIYGHAGFNLFEALGQADSGLASQLTSIGGLASWAVSLMIQFSKQAVNAFDEVKKWLDQNAGPFGSFIEALLPDVFALTPPDIHDVRPRLVKVDAGLIASMARVNTEDAYALEDKLPEYLQKISDYIQKWQDLAASVGLSGLLGPNNVQLTVDFSDNSLF